MLIQTIFHAQTGSRHFVVWAPAKVNLSLEIRGKRSDNYHEIASLMMAVDLFDVLIFEEQQSGTIFFRCDHPELSVGPENLVYRAAHLLKDRSGCTLGATIVLLKRIPWAAGLGGGSSDAAATLTGLNLLWQLGWSSDQLAQLGAELGSDVPFFFHTPAAWCTGRGEIVEPVTLVKPLDLVLICPSEGLNTAKVYQQYAQNPTAEMTSWDSKEIVPAVQSGDVEQIASCLRNDLQSSAMSLCPTVERWYRRLRTTRAAGCLMSGSGSSLFAICRSSTEALQVMMELQSGTPSEELAQTRMYVVHSCF